MQTHDRRSCRRGRGAPRRSRGRTRAGGRRAPGGGRHREIHGRRTAGALSHGRPAGHATRGDHPCLRRPGLQPRDGSGVHQLLRPHWGRFSDRTRSAPGNHEYKTADAKGYFGFLERQDSSHGRTARLLQLPAGRLAPRRPRQQHRCLGRLGAGALAQVRPGRQHRAMQARLSTTRGSAPGSTATPWRSGRSARSSMTRRVSIVLAGHDRRFPAVRALNPSGEVERHGACARSWWARRRAFARAREARRAARPGTQRGRACCSWSCARTVTTGHSCPSRRELCDSGSGTCVPGGEGGDQTDDIGGPWLRLGRRMRRGAHCETV